MSPEMKRMEEQYVLTSVHGRMADHPTRFVQYDFRQTVIEHSNWSSSEISAIPHRSTTPGTPVIDRGFESMIDHKSMIDQRIDSPMGRRHNDKDSDESHEPTSIPLSLPKGPSTSAERAEDPPGGLKTPYLIPPPIAD